MHHIISLYHHLSVYWVVCLHNSINKKTKKKTKKNSQLYSLIHTRYLHAINIVDDINFVWFAVYCPPISSTPPAAGACTLSCNNNVDCTGGLICCVTGCSTPQCVVPCKYTCIWGSQINQPEMAEVGSIWPEVWGKPLRYLIIDSW